MQLEENGKPVLRSFLAGSSLDLLCKNAALDLWLPLRCFYFLKARRNANKKNRVEKVWRAAVLQEGLWYSRPCVLLSVLRARLAGLTSFA